MHTVHHLSCESVELTLRNDIILIKLMCNRFVFCDIASFCDWLVLAWHIQYVGDDSQLPPRQILAQYLENCLSFLPFLGLLG